MARTGSAAFWLVLILLAAGGYAYYSGMLDDAALFMEMENTGALDVCEKRSPRFVASAVTLDDWRFLDTNRLELTVRAYESITLQEVRLAVEDSMYAETDIGQTMSRDSTTTVVVDTSNNVAGDGPAWTTGSCATAEVTLVYDASYVSGALAEGGGPLRGTAP